MTAPLRLLKVLRVFRILRMRRLKRTVSPNDVPVFVFVLNFPRTKHSFFASKRIATSLS